MSESAYPITGPIFSYTWLRREHLRTELLILMENK